MANQEAVIITVPQTHICFDYTNHLSRKRASIPTLRKVNSGASLSAKTPKEGDTNKLLVQSQRMRTTNKGWQQKRPFPQTEPSSEPCETQDDNKRLQCDSSGLEKVARKTQFSNLIHERNQQNKLSLYEMLYLKQHLNLEKLRNQAYLHSTGRCDGRTSSAVINSARGLALYSAKGDLKTRVIRSKPVIFDPGRSLENGSRKARYEKIAYEFADLRDRIAETDLEKTATLCIAFIEKHAGIKQVVYNRRHLENFIEFVKQKNHGIPKDKTMLEVIMLVLSGSKMGEYHRRCQSQPIESCEESVVKFPKQMGIVERFQKFKNETISNTPFWINESKRIPTTVKSDVKKHTGKLGNMLETLISSKVPLDQPLEQYDAYTTKKKISRERVRIAKTATKNRAAISRKRLLLEDVMYRRTKDIQKEDGNEDTIKLSTNPKWEERKAYWDSIQKKRRDTKVYSTCHRFFPHK